MVGRRALLPFVDRLDADRGGRRSAGRSRGTGAPVQWSSSSSPVVTERARWTRPCRPGLIVCAGALAFAALTWAFWDVYNAAHGACARPAAGHCWTYPSLVRKGEDIHRSHALLVGCAQLPVGTRGLASGFPGWKSVPPNPHLVRTLKWAAIVRRFSRDPD